MSKYSFKLKFMLYFFSNVAIIYTRKWNLDFNLFFSRRAMNKSFQESGGTVLSTNWSEVGKSQVEVKPPDGMEFKKWE